MNRLLLSRRIVRTLRNVNLYQSRYFGQTQTDMIDFQCELLFGERKYDEVLNYVEEHKLQELLGPPSINAVMSASSITGSDAKVDSSVGIRADYPKSELYLLLHKYCLTNNIAIVDGLLLSLLDTYYAFYPDNEVYSDFIYKLFGEGKQVSRVRKNFGSFLSEVALNSDELLLNIDGPDQEWKNSLIKAYSSLINAKYEEIKTVHTLQLAEEKMKQLLRKLNPLQDNLYLTTNIIDQNAIDDNDKVKEILILTHDTSEEEMIAAETEINETDEAIVLLNNQLRAIQNDIAQKDLKLRVLVNDLPNQVQSCKSELYVWSTFVRFYASRGAWQQCAHLISLAEMQHELPPQQEFNNLLQSYRIQFSAMYHELIKALCQSNQFELALSTLEKLRKNNLPIEVSAVRSLLSAFSTSTPSANFTVTANNYEALGRLLVSFNEDIVKLIMEVGDKVPETNLSKNITGDQYRAIISTAGYSSTVTLIEMYMTQLIKLSQFKKAEQMITFLHQEYPMFLTSKVLQSFIGSLKLQGRYTDVVKYYTLWSKSALKKHQENVLYHDVFESVRLQDGADSRRSLRFLDANNRKVDTHL